MHSSKLWKFHVCVDDEVVDPVTDYSHTAHADTCAIIYERLSVIQTMIRLRSPILRYQTDPKNSSQVKTLMQFNWKFQLEHLTEQQLAILDQFALADMSGTRSESDRGRDPRNGKERVEYHLGGSWASCFQPLNNFQRHGWLDFQPH